MRAGIRRGLLFSTLLAILGAVLIGVWSTGDGSRGGEDLRGDFERSDAPSTGSSAAASAASSPREEQTPSGETIERSQFSQSISRPILAGCVRDARTGDPVTAFDLRVWRTEPGREWVRHETVKDRDGRFSWELESAGTYALRVRSSRHRECKRSGIEVTARGRADLLVELDPGLGVSGRVLEDATGAPVAGAVVGATDAMGYSYDSFLYLAFGYEEHDRYARTDEEGRFHLSGLEAKKLRIAALHPDYAEGFADAVPGEDSPQMEIRLRRGARIYGRALDDAGRPAAGLVIRLFGPNLPIHRIARTDESGCYRSAPVLPGWVRVQAEPPLGELEESVDFTRELKNVQVSDGDLEVNFGPLPEQITWRGRVFDYDGTPLAGARLRIRKQYRNAGLQYYPEFHYTRCDENARFEMRKISEGEYKVNLRFADDKTSLDLSDFTLKGSGVIERDLHVNGAVIRGTVLDGTTGEVVGGAGGHVSASAHLSGFKFFSDALDEEGRFSLRGLEPGEYQVSAQADGYPLSQSRTVTLASNEVVELVITLTRGGTLVLKLEGFTGRGRGMFEIEIRRAKEGRQLTSRGNLEADGTCERRIDLAGGAYEAVLVFENWGTIRKPFAIESGRETEVLVRPGDREGAGSGDEVLTLEGSLSLEGGKPLAGASLYFFCRKLPGLSKEETRAKTKMLIGHSDSDGKFSITGFRAGRWDAFTRFSDGSEHQFTHLDIGESEKGRARVDLVLPAGRLSGELHDALTGRPFDEKKPTWWVFLKDAESGESVTELNGGHRGSAFELVGIPGGTYRLEVQATGYSDHVDENIMVAPGKELELGAIYLEPSAILDLEVVDERGSPVPRFEVSCNGKVLKPDLTKDLGAGKRRYSKVPPESVKITVKSDGYLDQSRELHLQPGQSTSVRIVLRART